MRIALIVFFLTIGLLSGPDCIFAGTDGAGRDFRNSAAAAANGGVNINSEGNRLSGGATITSTSSPGIAIADLATVSNEIQFVAADNQGEALRVKKVTVKVNITHTFIGDLVITLTHGGASATLMTSRGGTLNGMDITFNDSATLAIASLPLTTDPATGTFRPETPLSVFKSTSNSSTTGNSAANDVRGAWVLTVQDVFIIDSGTLNSWTLNVETFNVLTSRSASQALNTNNLTRAQTQP